MDVKNRKKRKLHFSVSFVLMLIMVPFIVALTAGLGTVLATQSIASQKAMVTDKTVEMATTAAELIRPYGDELVGLDEDDKDTPAYKAVYDILAAFRIANAGTSGELAFIYGCRERADGTFEFTIDPSDDPAEFGEDIEETYAIRQASEGNAAFDSEPYTDRWGSFYSAYAPVFDSQKHVAMIVGIDVWANWYQNTIWTHSRAIIIVTAIAIVSGVVLGGLLVGRLGKRLRTLINEMGDLEEDVRLLTADIRDPNAPVENTEEKVGDEVLALRAKIHSAQKELHDYIEYTKRAAYIDPLTQVGSRASYNERIEHLDSFIPFGVLVIDINDLKSINDTYGHDTGDRAIMDTAKVLKTVFGEKDVFRIGGDELVVLLFVERMEAEALMERFDEELKKYNETSDLRFTLSISKGLAFYEAEDRHYADVFRRADAKMYLQKNEYHRTQKAGKK